MTLLRLDAEMVRRGLVDSRSKAQSLIKDGLVQVSGQTVTKPAALVTDYDPIDLLVGSVDVGRGATKLRHAIATFDLDLRGATVVDVGASTGGFTQVALEAGAHRVIAIDVGHGQLHTSLARDPRVINCEGHHVAELTRQWWLDQGWGEPQWVVVDLSFISTASLISHLASLFPEANLVVLVKPQFEVGRGKTSEGVVTSQRERERALESVCEELRRMRFQTVLSTASPIEGKRGNVEYLVYGSRHELAE